MPKCIYSLKENVEFNEEHIFPAFLGGKWMYNQLWKSGVYKLFKSRRNKK